MCTRAPCFVEVEMTGKGQMGVGGTFTDDRRDEQTFLTAIHLNWPAD